MSLFLKSLGGIIVVIIVALIVIVFIGWSRAPDIIANNLSKKMKVSVSIDEINFGFKSIEIEKIEIGNPPGSILSKAASAETVVINAPILNYFEQKIIIDEMDVNDIYLGLEFESASGVKGNWTTIMENLKASTSTPKGKEEKATRTVLIKKLIFNNIITDVVYRKEGGKVKRLPTINQIVLTDVSSEGGIPMDQLMNTVLGQMLRQVFVKQNLKNMLQDIIENPPEAIEKFIEPLQPFKGLFQ